MLTGVAEENVASRQVSSRADPFLMCPGNHVLAYTNVLNSSSYFGPMVFEQLPPHRLCSGSPIHEKNIRAGMVLQQVAQANSFVQASVNWKITIRPSCSGSRDLSAPEQLANVDGYNCFATEVHVRNNCP